MTTTQIKSDLIKKIERLNSTHIQEVYGMLLNYLNSKKSFDNWNQLTENQKESIEEGLSQLDKGLGIRHKEVMTKYRKKYSK